MYFLIMIPITFNIKLNVYEVSKRDLTNNTVRYYIRGKIITPQIELR